MVPGCLLKHPLERSTKARTTTDERKLCSEQLPHGPLYYLLYEKVYESLFPLFRPHTVYNTVPYPYVNGPAHPFACYKKFLTECEKALPNPGGLFVLFMRKIKAINGAPQVQKNATLLISPRATHPLILPACPPGRGGRGRHSFSSHSKISLKCRLN